MAIHYLLQVHFQLSNLIKEILLCGGRLGGRNLIHDTFNAPTMKSSMMV